jgi:hypothetical protein
MADVEVKNEGTVALLIPMSSKGKAWIDENLQLEGWQWYGNAAAVEARYVDPIVLGMQDDGLEVEGTTRVIPEESDMTPEQEEEMVRRGQLSPMERRSSRTGALAPAAVPRPGPDAQAGRGMEETEEQTGGPVARGDQDDSDKPLLTPAMPTTLNELPNPEMRVHPIYTRTSGMADGRAFRSPWLRQAFRDGYCDACDRPEAQCICSPEDCDLTRKRGATNWEAGESFAYGTRLREAVQYIVGKAHKEGTAESYLAGMNKLLGIRTFLVFTEFNETRPLLAIANEASRLQTMADSLGDRRGKTGAEKAARMTPEQAGYMELRGARKDGDCSKVAVPGGVSLVLGCCNRFEPLDEGTSKFSCGTCEYGLLGKGKRTTGTI